MSEGWNNVAKRLPILPSLLQLCAHGSPLRYNFWTTSSAPCSPACHKARATVLQEGDGLSVRKMVEYALGSCLLSYWRLSSTPLEFGIWSHSLTSSICWTPSRTLVRVSSVNDGSVCMWMCTCMCVCVWRWTCAQMWSVLASVYSTKLMHYYIHNIHHCRHGFAV